MKKELGGGICHSIHRHGKENKKYIKDYDKESSYLMYLYADNLYGLALSQKLLVGDFKWKKTLINLIKT